MQTILRIISGLILGSGPVAISAVLIFVIIGQMPNIYSYVISVLLGIGGLILGGSILRMVYHEGAVVFLTRLTASRSYDDMTPQAGDTTQKLTAAEFVALNFNTTEFCLKGSFQLFHDWVGKPHKDQYEIDSAAYDEAADVLQLNFSKGAYMTIQQPRNIIVANTFFKILDAEIIQMNWPNVEFDKGTAYIRYEKGARKVLTEGNLPKFRKRYNASLSRPSLMLFGAFK